MPTISYPIDFDKDTPRRLAVETPYGENWPVVYLINNDDEIYIGETTDVSVRTAQHLENKERRRLSKIRIISDDKYNKSVVLDLESFLIQHMHADGTFKLQNGNGGLQNHNYYQREAYEKEFQQIWAELKKLSLVRYHLKQIESSNLFKYSPYKSLTSDQYMIVAEIIKQLALDIKAGKRSTFLVNGGAGTGKTILGIFMMKLIADQVSQNTDAVDEELIESLQTIHESTKNLKIGIVVSMENLRDTLKKTFRSIHGLTQDMVLRPSEVARAPETFDILIVDEAHRLKRRKNMAGYELKSVYKTNKMLGLDEDLGTQLDWVLKKSKHQIFLYDQTQSVKPTDVRPESFQKLRKMPSFREYNLKTQIRCARGGDEYIQYIKQLFSNNHPVQKQTFPKYDFKIFDDVNAMVEQIKQKDKEFNLCRNVAGYAWKWKTKGKIFPENAEQTRAAIQRGMYDIEIDGHKYIWNTQGTNWSNSPNAINEIGCIHTIQGFDLNYAGVIIGDELKYDQATRKLYIDRNNYHDRNGKIAATDEELFTYIMNIYSTLCTRGILGTYIYACDEGVRNYLKQYISA